MDIYILGISAYYHDSAACLLKNGKLICAAHEERFTRIKHDSNFPKEAVSFCLKNSGIKITEVDHVVYYEKPIRKFSRILDECVNLAPFGFNRFRKSLKSWLGNKLWISSNIKKELNYTGKIYFSEHHQSHAASSFFSSQYDKATIVTMDGVGEDETVLIALGENNKITPLESISYPDSPGLFYSAFTQYCGFKVNSGEYKLMGLAPYGKPIYVDLIKNKLIKLNDDGSFEINQKYFDYRHGERMINSKFESLFGELMRKPESPMTEFYQNVASSAQRVMEELVISIIKHAINLTGNKQLCLAGGVALNCVANSKVIDEVTDQLYVYPASGDAGGCVGAAFSFWYDHLKNDRLIVSPSLLNTVYLGPEYSDDLIRKELDSLDVIYQSLSSSDMIDQLAQRLQEKSVVGWFQGRSEFGPRALGNRSILASPAFDDMQQYVNLKIKKREGFRPFAPIVIDEFASDYFELKESSKFMLTTSKAMIKEEYPSCVHVDSSSRVQVLRKEDNEKLHDLILKFKELSGLPILINTSFNLRGEPIVNSPADALNSFFNCEMDILVLGNVMIDKKSNSHLINQWQKLSYEMD